MINVNFRTNLDLHPGEQWPRELSFRPMVGDLVRSETRRKNFFYLELEIVRVVITGPDSMNVEMHLPKNRFGSISAFQEWYSNICR